METRAAERRIHRPTESNWVPMGRSNRRFIFAEVDRQASLTQNIQKIWTSSPSIQTSWRNLTRRVRSTVEGTDTSSRNWLIDAFISLFRPSSWKIACWITRHSKIAKRASIANQRQNKFVKNVGDHRGLAERQLGFAMVTEVKIEVAVCWLMSEILPGCNLCFGYFHT